MTTPEDFRLLVQLVDAPTVAEAQATILRMFGPRALGAAVFEPGCERMPNNGVGAEWEWREDGYRVYVPRGFRL